MEKKSTKTIVLGITSLLVVTLLLLGLTYAYYRTKIIGNENETSISVTSKSLELIYGDGNGYVIGTNELVIPGKEFAEKTFTVTNTGDRAVQYVVVLENVSITDENGDAVDLTSTTVGKNNDFELVITCDNGECNGYNDE